MPIPACIFRLTPIKLASMSKIGEVIRDIAAWEAEAEAISRRSEEEAEGLIEKARADSAEQISAVEARCAAERERLIAAAESEGRELADRIVQESQEELCRLKEWVKSRRADAVDLVLKEMREICGSR